MSRRQAPARIAFTSFVDIYQKEPRESLAVNSDKFGISYRATGFANCSFKIQIMNGSVTNVASKTESSRKHRLFLKKAISCACVQSFTGFSIHMM